MSKNDKSNYKSAIEYGEELVSILSNINNGFEERGGLQRKFGRALFKKRAKMKIDLWIVYANELVPKLKRLNEGDKSVIYEFPDLLERLGNLIKYHIKTAETVKNFFEGEELQEILSRLINSENKIRTFIKIIESIDS